MKQILQDLKSGKTTIEDVPTPSVSSGTIAVASTYSLISAGTERMLIDFGKANLIEKARQQPDKVRQVLEKAKTDGILPTLQTVRSKLNEPLPLGYCNVGVIRELGSNVQGFEVGDRVVSNGKHAEVVVVPPNLCAKVPDDVDDESAVFTVLASIALQGIRLIAPTLGESVAVIGLGMIGLIAVQILKANGCRVIGIDYDKKKLQSAESFGAATVNLARGEDPIKAAQTFSQMNGVDAVLIAASTNSDEPIHQAANMSRKRGRIVLVGVVGMQFSRADFYEKELTFQVSCSYGPGRYDPQYEEKSNDYPIGFVRWTEKRNFEAILDMMADQKLDVTPLITHRFSFDDAIEAYTALNQPDCLGVLLNYQLSNQCDEASRFVTLSPAKSKATSKVCIGFIGAGNYAKNQLIPAFVKTNSRLKYIASSTGVSSVHTGKKFSVETAITDPNIILGDDETNTIVITTRHNNHAQFVIAGLNHGKHVFVEKPLALNRTELIEIESLCRNLGSERPHLMVGFNRRYSPFVQRIKCLLGILNVPKSIVMTINAGQIPSTHWTQDPTVGGGRVIGEVCHFIDLLRFVAGSPIEKVQSMAMDSQCKDSVIINLKFDDGSIGAINYLSNGSKAFPKERLEVFCDGGILVLDNFRILQGFGWPGFKRQSGFRQDKGQFDCAKAFVNAVRIGTDAQLIPLNELFEVTDCCFTICEQLGVPVPN